MVRAIKGGEGGGKSYNYIFEILEIEEVIINN